MDKKQAITINPSYCKKIKDGGRQCGARPMDNGYCKFHQRDAFNELAAKLPPVAPPAPVPIDPSAILPPIPTITNPVAEATVTGTEVETVPSICRYVYQETKARCELPSKDNSGFCKRHMDLLNTMSPDEVKLYKQEVISQAFVPPGFLHANHLCHIRAVEEWAKRYRPTELGDIKKQSGGDTEVFEELLMNFAVSIQDELPSSERYVEEIGFAMFRPHDVARNAISIGLLVLDLTERVKILERALWKINHQIGFPIILPSSVVNTDGTINREALKDMGLKTKRKMLRALGITWQSHNWRERLNSNEEATALICDLVEGKLTDAVKLRAWDSVWSDKDKDGEPEE